MAALGPLHVSGGLTLFGVSDLRFPGQVARDRVVLLIVSLLSSWLRSLRTTPLRRSMNGDLRRSEGGSSAMRGSSAVKECLGAPSPEEFFGALSVLDAAEPGGMPSRYGANGKTGLALPIYWRP